MTTPLGVGVIGTGWMARAHVHAIRTVGAIAPAARRVRLVVVASSEQERAARAARAWGFSESTASWRRVAEHPDVDVVVNAGSDDLHAEPSIAALQSGKNVLCEKPLATTAAAAEEMAAVSATVPGRAICAFNYRFVPAVRLLHRLVSDGYLGEVRQYRGAFLQDWAASPDVPRTWRFERARSASGPIGDYAHIIDLLRHLAGEPVSVTAEAVTLVPIRPSSGGSEQLPVEVHDAYVAGCRLEGGGLATLEASRTASGRKGHQHVELYCSRGAVWWNQENLNRLHVYSEEEQPHDTAGFRDVLVTEPTHPYLEHWWGSGHILGWDHALAHQWLAVLHAVESGELGPLASFTDGAQAARITDAIAEAAATGRRIAIEPSQRETAT